MDSVSFEGRQEEAPSPVAAKRQWKRTFFMGSIVVGLSVLFAALVFELYYRYDLSVRIDKVIGEAPIWFQNQTLTRHEIVDDFFGRTTKQHPKGLFKIDTTFDIAVAHPTHGVLNFSVKSNNVGLLSEMDYQLERDPQKPEYRIVVLGDSLTGPTTATYQWVDTIEELLNGNEALRASVGNKQFRVYNLGWVGAGFNSFWQAYERSGQYFSPDLVVLNYVDVDFPRGAGGHFKTEGEMIEHAKLHISKLFAAQKNIMFAVMPTYNEMLPKFTEPALTHKLMKEDPRVKVEIMRDRLPTHLGSQEIENWFNVPHDAHYSDRGGEIYARALAGVMVERITGAKIDFSEIVSKHSPEVLGPDTPRTRKITNSLSHLVDSTEKVTRIKEYIRGEMRQGKLYSPLYSLTWNRLLGSGSDGLSIPYTTPLIVNGVKIPFGENSDDVGFLSVACESEPISLRNPRCYHHFHVFTR